MNINQLNYAIAKQIPDMARGFVIQTNYGEIAIDSVDAPTVIDAVKAIIQRNIKAQRDE